VDEVHGAWSAESNNSPSEVKIMRQITANCNSLMILASYPVIFYLFRAYVLSFVRLLLTAATAMVSIEVFRRKLHYMNDNVKTIEWFRGNFSYGFSFGFACVTFILLAFSGVAFLLVSGKRKREKALSEREAKENEPVQLGR